MNDDDVLAERLDEELGRFEPGHAPVAAVISRGKAAKAKRRAAVTGWLAVATVLGVSLPLAAQGIGGSASSTGRHRVVVNPPHTDAKGVLTFSGAVDGKAWSVNPAPSGDMKDCLLSLGDCPDRFPPPVDPVEFGTEGGEGSGDSYIATFRPDVSVLDVFLADGSRLALQPALIGSHRVAVFMLPHGFLADRAVAHTATGEQVSIPFHDPNGLNTFVAWYAPDAVPDLAQVSRQVASGAAKDRTGKNLTWTVTAYVGPFGVCIETQQNGAGGSNCHSPAVYPSAALPFTKVVINGFSPDIIATEVDPSVSHIQVTFLDHTEATLTPIQIGGHDFVAVAVPLGGEIVSAVSIGRNGAILANPDGAVPTKP